MKTRPIVVSHLVAAAAGAALFIGLGAGKPLPQPQPMDAKAMQAATEVWMKSMKTGEQHEMLAKFAGEWTTTTSIFMAPGAPPMVTQGTASMKMVHGGRFLEQTFTGSMKFPGPDGKMMDAPMTGTGLTGFDNNRKLFNFVWADNMSTGYMTGRGSLSQDKKTLTMFAEMDEPMTGEIGKPVRCITRFESNDRMVFEIAEIIYGDPFTVLKVEYARKGAKPDLNK